MNNLKIFNSYSDLTTYKNNNFVSPHVYFESDTKKLHYFKGYQLLDHISSTASGGQYIDLGCKLMENTDDIRIDMKFNFKGHGKTGKQQSTFIASQPETSPYPGFTCRIAAQNIETSIEFTLKWFISDELTPRVDGNRYYYKKFCGASQSNTNIKNSYETNTIIEESILLSDIPQAQCNNMNTHLFCALNSSGQPFRFSEVDVYYMKIYKGNTLIRSLWPVRKKSDNTIGLYDVVNDNLYVSQGDDPFVGTEINNE